MANFTSNRRCFVPQRIL